jgi:hypothetical protein
MLNRLSETYGAATPSSLQSMSLMNQEDYIKVKNCLLTIDDPLWCHVCQEVATMMGPASFFKIWTSHLGEICPQNKTLEVYCHTEEASQFIQQYAFVILGSLRAYFPALRKLNVKTIGA